LLRLKVRDWVPQAVAPVVVRVEVEVEVEVGRDEYQRQNGSVYLKRRKGEVHHYCTSYLRGPYEGTVQELRSMVIPLAFEYTYMYTFITYIILILLYYSATLLNFYRSRYLENK